MIYLVRNAASHDLG